MRFPYAYYRSSFNGRIYGSALTADFLALTPSVSEGGEIDVTSNSQIELDPTSGNITITGFKGGIEGQQLYITNTGVGANKVVVSSQNGSVEQPFYNPGETDIFIEAFQTIEFRLVNYSGVLKWISVNQGYLQLEAGTEDKPSLYMVGYRGTGIFSGAENSLSITTNSLARITLNETVNSLVQHRFSDGTIANPALSFITDPTSGFSRDTATGAIVWSIGSIEFARTLLGGMTIIPNLSTSDIRQDDPVNIKKINTEEFSGVNMLDLVVSDNPLDRANEAQPNGIYSKGDVKTGGEFIGTATSAEYAGLAGRYSSDSLLEPGDVVQIGGAQEITKAWDSFKVFGVISTEPAFRMNDSGQNDDEYPFVALTGRVPCKVVGEIEKGDYLILSSSDEGVAEAYKGALGELNPLLIMGTSLESSMVQGIKEITIAIRR